MLALSINGLKRLFYMLHDSFLIINLFMFGKAEVKVWELHNVLKQRVDSGYSVTSSH